MKKTDELDRAGAAAYAWKLFTPGEDVSPAQKTPAGAHEGGAARDTRGDATTDAEASADGEPDADSQQDDAELPDFMKEPTEAEAAATLQTMRHEAFEGCAALVDGVHRAWSLPPAEQAALVETLLLRAVRLGIGLSAMQNHPLESVRLLRLAVRCGDELPDDAREAARSAVLWLELSDPEIVELLCECALREDEDLAGALAFRFALRLSEEEGLARIRGASARFATLLDHGPSFVTRRIATNWLRVAPARDAIPALRRALRLPHFGLRYRAFDILERAFPDAVTAEDLLFLLEEAVIHPPPELRDEESARARAYFPELLEQAVVRLRPAGGVAPLLRIARYRCVRRGFRLGGLDATWALGVAAAAYPDEAVPEIDALTRYIDWDRRQIALEAAGKLPDTLAWPRLLAAAADARPELAARAAQIWLERRGTLCPLDELAGIDGTLLRAPLDETTRSRLALLRHAPLPARAAMTEVLLGEAPDPKALALLLFAARDSYLWDLRPRPGLPTDRTDFARTLVARFGDPAVAGLCTLAAHHPEGRRGWLDALEDLARDDELPRATHPIVRDAAARRIAESERAEHAPLALCAKVGTPSALFDRLWAIAQDPSEDSFMRDAAADALARLPPDDHRVEPVVLAAMSAALEGGDHLRFSRAAVVGARRNLPAAVTLIERTLAEHALARVGDDTITQSVRICVRELQKLGRLSDDWWSEMLRHPDTHGSVVSLGHDRRNATPEQLTALREALSSNEPVTAGTAALALIWLRELPAGSPEALAITGRAPPPLRSHLLWYLVYNQRKKSLRPFWPMLEVALTSADAAVTEPLWHIVHSLAQSDVREELRALWPRVVNVGLREELAERFEDDELKAYWQDVERVEEEEEEEAAEAEADEGDGG